ncbi:MAG: hypothetical protein KJ063_07195 [Anaerolineae bacterium]|nr:hypothetical protein [Anaerolineae bacterium]
MFQAKLEICELAYLLHSLNAEQVIGLDNERLFPTDSAATQTLLETGLTALKTNGWLVPDEYGFKMAPQLWLLTAIMVQPEQIVVYNRRVESAGEQVVTYYLSQDIIVEQFLSKDDHYLLSHISGVVDFINHLSHLLNLPEQRVWEQSFELDLTLLQAIQKGDFTALEQIQLGEIKPETKQNLQTALTSLVPYASLDILFTQDGYFQSSKQMIFLQAGNGAIWLLTTGTEDNSFTLHPLDGHYFTALWQRQLAKTKTP